MLIVFLLHTIITVYRSIDSEVLTDPNVYSVNGKKFPKLQKSIVLSGGKSTTKLLNRDVNFSFFIAEC